MDFESFIFCHWNKSFNAVGKLNLKKWSRMWFVLFCRRGGGVEMFKWIAVLIYQKKCSWIKTCWRAGLWGGEGKWSAHGCWVSVEPFLPEKWGVIKKKKNCNRLIASVISTCHYIKVYRKSSICWGILQKFFLGEIFSCVWRCILTCYVAWFVGHFFPFIISAIAAISNALHTRPEHFIVQHLRK